ncbi:MAG: cytochrome c [Bacteroidota bacterium]|nr:cytochrome c [Bacteroidota bacterium]
MKKYGLLILLLIIVVRLNAQSWEVPDDKKAKVSPVQFSSETAKKGEVIFLRNCQSCHGNPTKGNFANLIPSPGDPATDKFQKQTDGALFYKITTGRSPMPQFKDVLTEEERWQVISYFRSFNKNYVQPPVASASKVAAKQAALTVVWEAASRKLKVTASDTLKRSLKGVGVLLFVKRYFGNMQIGEEMTTNDSGIVRFDFPKDIPGDKTGNLDLIIRINSEKGDDVQKTVRLPLGVIVDKPPLTLPRAMWNVVWKSPVWLLLAYFLVVIGVWSFLIYIIYQLVKMKRRAGNV